ncbi:MAG: YraN family protein [Muricoprocola sp.]
MNKRAIGKEIEDSTIKYLESCGYHILERNYQIRSGEIDIIARESCYLVFIEVKYRKNKSMGYAQESVTIYKQKKIIQTAKHYLLTHGMGFDVPCRFDVVAVNGSEITVIKDAFQLS